MIAKGKLDPPDFERDFSDLTTEISEAVISQLTMAMKGSPRYKFACQTVIGEDDGQSVRVTSRCLWDTRTDNSASAVWKNVRARAKIPAAAAGLTALSRRRASSTRPAWCLLSITSSVAS